MNTNILVDMVNAKVNVKNIRSLVYIFSKIRKEDAKMLSEVFRNTNYDNKIIELFISHYTFNPFFSVAKFCLVMDGLKGKDSEIIYKALNDRFLLEHYDSDNSIVKIVETLEFCDFEPNVFRLLYSDYFRSFNIFDQVRLIKELKKHHYSEAVLQLFIKEDSILGRDVNQMIVLADELKNHNYSPKVLEILLDDRVLEFRNTRQIVRLIKEFKKSSYNEKVSHIIRNNDILSQRRTHEQIVLIRNFKKCNYNSDFYYLIINSNILKYRKNSEQLKLIEVYNNNSNDITLEFLKVPVLLEYKTNEEQIKLYNVFSSCDFNPNVFRIIKTEKIVRNMDVDDIIKLIEVLKLCNYSNEATNAILSFNKHVLKRTDDIVKLVLKLNELNFNNFALMLALNDMFFMNRTIDEMLILIDKIKEYNYNPLVIETVLSYSTFSNLEIFSMLDGFVVQSETDRGISFNKAIERVQTEEELKQLLSLVEGYEDTDDVLIDLYRGKCYKKSIFKH